MFFKWFQPFKNLFKKIKNGEVVGNLFSEKMIHDLLESHNFLKFSKVYRTVKELGIQAFTEQFLKIYRIFQDKIRNIPRFRECFYLQLLNSSINFIELFFSVCDKRGP